MADVRSLLRQERAARQQKPSSTPATAPASKKRKAADDGAIERKRTRTEEAAGVPAGFFDEGANASEEAPQHITQEDGDPASAKQELQALPDLPHLSILRSLKSPQPMTQSWTPFLKK